MPQHKSRKQNISLFSMWHHAVRLFYHFAACSNRLFVAWCYAFRDTNHWTVSDLKKTYTFWLENSISWHGFQKNAILQFKDGASQKKSKIPENAEAREKRPKKKNGSMNFFLMYIFRIAVLLWAQSYNFVNIGASREIWPNSGRRARNFIVTLSDASSFPQLFFYLCPHGDPSDNSSLSLESCAPGRAFIPSYYWLVIWTILAYLAYY